MSTTEHRPATPAGPAPSTPVPAPVRPVAPQPVERPFTDDPTNRLHAVVPRTRRPSDARPHLALAGELAALAFTAPPAVPAQRGPSALEFRR